MFRGRLIGVLVKIQGVPERFKGCFKKVPKLGQGSFIGILNKFQECFQSDSRKHEGIENDILSDSMMFQEYWF